MSDRPRIYEETFTLYGWNDDLSYLKEKVRGYFSKIFYHLYDDNNKNKNGKKWAINIVKSICNNDFSKYRPMVFERLAKNGVLLEAIDQLDKIINHMNESRLFSDLKESRILSLEERLYHMSFLIRGENKYPEASDQITCKFIAKYSKPYLIELFNKKNEELQNGESCK